MSARLVPTMRFTDAVGRAEAILPEAAEGANATVAGHSVAGF